MRVLAVIPARRGSKGVPGKNIRLLGGKPLLQYTAEAALRAHTLDRIVLSTDSEEIAEVGRSCGLEVPFLRPATLAKDTTPTLPVLQHAVRAVEQSGDVFDVVCLLQPTTPLRSAETIDACVELLVDSDADSVITVLRVPDEYNPHWVYFQTDDGCLQLSTGENSPISRRQALPEAYHREGSVYAVRKSTLMGADSLYGSRTVGLAIDRNESVNIDTPEDWFRAEQMIQARETGVAAIG